ncbi:acetate/propionate family kinase [Flagellimonas alvinocaridis]|uniref:Acetate kinase n=1 Tax=Flagellimonas alvinocaridis TaxID=2530200 RepID=A0A4S8RNM7_9FLAO|nr:acetate/propionate family kinase [Allomuricauda alvinocaridis]THV59442.1 acetate/propionate family kinase [Allomuricauda alvinocaridis]
MYLQNPLLLTISAGPSNIRFTMYEMAENPVKELFGDIRHLGSGKEVFRVTHVKGNERENSRIYAPGFYQATVFLIGWLKNQPGFDRIGYIGHKITYGLNYPGPKVIDTALLNELKQIADYNIPNCLSTEIEIVETFTMRFPALQQVAFFDTSFLVNLPKAAKIPPFIPRHFERARTHGHGFHGQSFSHIMMELKKRIGIQKADGRLILAHLGKEASITAVKEGKSIDAGMGFTPLGGVVMGTRSGDLDLGDFAHLLKKERMGSKQPNSLTDDEGGSPKISETSTNMLDLLLKEDVDRRAAEAVTSFCYQVRKWIGAFTAVLGGLDVLVFSGDIGENSPIIRSRICQGLDFLGIGLDEGQNRKNSSKISKEQSKVLVMVIHADEELVIAESLANQYFKDKSYDKVISPQKRGGQKRPRVSTRKNIDKFTIWDG